MPLKSISENISGISEKLNKQDALGSNAGIRAGCLLLSDAPAAAHLQDQVPPPVPCEFCGKLRYHRLLVNGSVHPCTLIHLCGLHPCTCREAQLQEQRKQEDFRKAEQRKIQAELFERRVAKLAQNANLGVRFKTRTLENYLPAPENAAGHESCRKYSQCFPNILQAPQSFTYLGLYLYGSIGTGKTHLACAIANKIFESGYTTLFTNIPQITRDFKTIFDASNQGTSENDILELYSKADLLIIDDLGKDIPTKWGLSRLFEIINQRYENSKPIIVTSNYDMQQLAQVLKSKDSSDSFTRDALLDRLQEICKPIKFTGASYRKRQQTPA